MTAQEMICLRQKNMNRLWNYNGDTINCIRRIEKLLEEQTWAFMLPNNLFVLLDGKLDGRYMDHNHVKEYFQKEGYVTELLLLPHAMDHYTLKLSWSEGEQNDKV